MLWEKLSEYINISYPLFLLAGTLLLPLAAFGQDSRTVAERLGYDDDAKLLVVHADDIGVTHSENAASISAYEQGAISSGSVMVPCPWFPEIASYARKNPDFDLGIHLTLTSEWKYYQWDGVMPSGKIPSLINEEGYFYETVQDLVKNAELKEIEKELRAQIERAIAYGINPTHLDAHMGGPSATPELFEIMISLGQEYKIPVRIEKSDLENPEYRKFVSPNYIISDTENSLNTSVPADDWNEAYDKIIKNLDPGLHELIVHLAYDNEEMRAVTVDKKHWYEAAWRQRDYDYVTSQRFRELLQKHNIKLVTW
ncbi:MAG: polysaccharide deacetylase family protein, partial [Bacteroidales bacterium]|nr:polysaccharide deacetylase family protein [Bacteroidales bacterium]